MLSAYLTLQVENKDEKVNLLEVIFNFLGNRNLTKIDSTTLQKKYTLSYLYDFITQWTTFSKSKPELLLFVKENATKLDENGFTFIRRTQINKSQFKLLLDNFKVQRNFSPWISALYVMGCAKATMPTSKMNVISLDNFYKNNITLAKAKIKQLFDVMGYVEKTDKNTIGNYSFSKDNKYCYFGVGFSKELEEQFFSKQKIKFDSVIEVQNILNSFNTQCTIPIVPENKATDIPNNSIESDNVISESMEDDGKDLQNKVQEKQAQQVSETVCEQQEDDQGAFGKMEPVDDIIKKYDERPYVYLDLGEQRRFSPDLIDRAINYENNHPGYFDEKFEKAKTNLTAEAIRVTNVHLSEGGKLAIDSMLKNYLNLTAVLKGGDLGKDWKQIKDAARTEQIQLKELLSNKFSKLYDKDIAIYQYVVWFILKNHKKALRDF